MSRLDEKLEIAGYDNLMNSTYPPAETFGVTIRKGQGLLERGTLLVRSSADGAMVIAGTTAAEGEKLTPNCILAEDVESGAGESAVGIAYRTGHFNENSLLVKDGYTVTDDDKEALRDAGILLSDSI